MRSPLCLISTLVLCGCFAAAADSFVVSRVAGNPGASAGISDGSIDNPTVARFDSPVSVAVDSAGSLYVVDTGSNAVRTAKLIFNGTVSTFAGSSTAGFLDGLAVDALFNGPEGIEVAPTNEIYVCDSKNHRIRRILAGAGSPVETLAGTGGRGSANGEGLLAEFDSPKAMVISELGVAFVCDTGNHTIRKIDLNTSNDEVTTLAGTPGLSGITNGTGAAARFKTPSGIAVTSSGIIYVADTGNHCIRKIVAATGAVSTLCGKAGTAGHKDGKTTAALFSSPRGLALDAAGNLLVCDTGNYVIRRVSSSGTVTTISGTVGIRGSKNGETGALYNSPTDICRASDGGTEIFYITDGRGSSAGDGGATIRKLQKKLAAPVITAHPVGLSVVGGSQAVFKITATAPSGKTLVYSWYKDGGLNPIGTGPILTLPDVTASDQGTYFARVVASDGGPVIQSFPAPLFIKGQQTWQWISRPGSTTPDTVLSLSFRESPTRGPELWASGLGGGHVLRKLSPITALPSKTIKVSSKGDGVPALAIDSAGGLYAGLDEVLVLDKPGLLNRYNASGTRLWSLRMGTKPLLSSTSPQAEVNAVALLPGDLPVVGGTFRGVAEFISRKSLTKTTLGSATHPFLRAFVGKLTADGDISWLRQVFGSNNTTGGDSAVRGIVTTNDAVYVCGNVGAGGMASRSNTAGDDQDLGTSVQSAPFVLKYDHDGALLWAHALDEQGAYFGLCLDAAGDLWVTGHRGDRGSAAQQTAVLRLLDADTGAIVDEVEAAFAKGCSVATRAGQGIAWLLADGAGRLEVLDRAFPDVPGYRVVMLDETSLEPVWDLPVFGRLAVEAEQADLVFAPDGKLYAGLNFAEEDRAKPVVDFAGRVQYSMKGRKQDGFIAVIGELPQVLDAPISQFVEKGSSVTFTSTYTGDIAPVFQWYKSKTALRGAIAADLVLNNVTTTTAGSYAVRMSNGRDIQLSEPASLAVIDTAPKTVTGKVRGTLTLKVSAAGEGLSYVWKQGGNVVNNTTGRFSGATTASLTVKALTLADAGSWQCEVTSSKTNPAKTLASGVTTLNVNP